MFDRCSIDVRSFFARCSIDARWMFVDSRWMLVDIRWMFGGCPMDVQQTSVMKSTFHVMKSAFYEIMKSAFHGMKNTMLDFYVRKNTGRGLAPNSSVRFTIFYIIILLCIS